MATINWIIQGKGGVGKSVLASMMFQFFQETGLEVTGWDVDAHNCSFGGYKEFEKHVHKLELIRPGETDIDPRAFDDLMDGLFGLAEGSQGIIDTGTSSWVSICSYIQENGALDMLREAGHRVYLHCPIAGGGSLGETLDGLATLLANFPDIPMVVWLNRHVDGEVSLDGKPFWDMKTYTENMGRFHAVLEIPYRNPATYGKDLAAMFAKRHSFKASINSVKLGMMVRQRLSIYWRDVVTVLQSANLT